MNEQLQQALASIITKATSGVEAGISFLSGQIPDVIQQLLMWKFAEAILYSVAGLIGLMLLIFFTIKYSGKGKETTEKGWRGEKQYEWTLTHDNDGDISPHIMATAPLVFIASLPCFAGVSKVMTAVQIWLAPKIYLIEYAASLVNK